MPLDEIATADGKRRYVRRLFATIADRYDLITVVLSYGQDAAWKRRAVDLAGVHGGTFVLDLACGTGDLALLAAARGARVVGVDITLRMIQLARAKSRGIPRRTPARPPDFAVGDLHALPIAPESVDVVTTGYGLRNLADLGAGLVEIHRVLKAGGVLVALDFNRPANRVIRAAYLAYLDVVGGALGWLLHRDSDTYRYIPASIRSYPGAGGVAALMRHHGFVDVNYYPVLGGLMALHRARKR
jgi:demethylmenaquinone methyltransferase / 2-methoxy-6-polyprenyl-1,4-benzoquinol methylase